MNLTIARLGPLIKEAGRIADALEIIAALYREDCERRGLVLRPRKPVYDPAELDDIQYTTDEAEWLREMKAQYGILSDEEKEFFKAGVSKETIKTLESEEEA